MAGRIGIDTGGTHTDLVYVDDAGSTASAVTRFVYGTTLVTNLIIEGGDVPVGLLTTEGFRDVIEIGRASRKLNIYDIH